MGPNTNTVEAVRIRVADTILKYCQEKGMTQKDLNCQLRMSESALSRLKNGERTLSVDDLFLVSQTCGVSLAYLVTGLDIDRDKAEKFNRLLRGGTPEQQGVIFDSLYSVAERARKMKNIS